MGSNVLLHEVVGQTLEVVGLGADGLHHDGEVRVVLADLLHSLVLTSTEAAGSLIEALGDLDGAGVADDAVSVVIADAVCYIPMAELVDFEKEKERLNKEKERLLKELERSEKMLSNENFVSKAPAAKLKEEQDKKLKYEQTLAQVEERLKCLK